MVVRLFPSTGLTGKPPRLSLTIFVPDDVPSVSNNCVVLRALFQAVKNKVPFTFVSSLDERQSLIRVVPSVVPSLFQRPYPPPASMVSVAKNSVPLTLVR